MKEKPRHRRSFIVNRPMFANLLLTSCVQLLVLGWLLWYFKTHDLDGLEDFKHFFTPDVANATLHPYELTFFFTTFVMLQFWNLFNVRIFSTSRSLFRAFRGNGQGFTLVALLILVGQILIVCFGGDMFGVQPLAWMDWLVIIWFTLLINFLIALASIRKKR
jgi:Ca2+-transporting ATPase